MKRHAIISLGIATLLLLTAGAPLLRAQAAAQKPPNIGDEVLASWNYIHGKLIAMAEDFPEDKYDFKPSPEVRTFAAQLLHVASTNFVLVNALSGKDLGPTDNDPSRSVYKTKADVVALLKKSTADGAALIKARAAQMGGVIKDPDGGKMKTEAATWMDYSEHSGEHYGQLVVYYRVNGMVPPDSRPKPK